MKAGKVLLGVAAGFGAGYVAVRTIEASIAWAHPPRKRERDAVAYGRLRRAFDVVETIRSIAGLAAFAYGRFGNRSDSAVRTIPAWLRPAPFFLTLSIASALTDLPVAFVQDYELERRFGLSDQSRRGWLADYFKSAAIGAAMTAFVATIFAAAVRRAPRTWPLWASFLTFPLFVAGNVIVPLYVMPLFNAFEPVSGSLEARLRRLAARFGVGDAEILRMDMSRQTRKANAFVTGIGQTHRIVLGDTLIDAFREDEIEFVVAHELGHYVSRDTWRLIGAGELLAATLFALGAASTPGVKDDHQRERPVLLARLAVTMLLASQALRPLLLAYARSREWNADRFALDATGDSAAGAAAFRRLRDQNLADADPPGWYELFFSSHPSLKKRIAALEAARQSS